jgi:hypothetical protein
MPRMGLKELASRNQDGLEVTLLWDARSNEVSIQVIDQPGESGFRHSIDGRLALDAFHHPYAYRLASESSRGRCPQTASAE